MSEELNELVKSRHPAYSTHLAHWDFLELTYEGGRQWFEENLFRYLKEGETEFTDRKKRAYRFNHSREVVDLVNKYLFRAVPTRNVDDAPEPLRRFWGSATKAGQDINFLMRNVAKKSSKLGRCYVIVDTNGPTGAISVQDEKKAKIRAFAYTIRPQDVLDMAFDDEGNLVWALIREFHRDNSNPLNGAGRSTQTRFRLWTKLDWYLIEDVSKKDEKPNFEITDEGHHALNRVPMIINDHIDHDSPYYAPALINDISYLDRAVGNYLSNLDAVIQDQTFSQLAMPAQALMPGEEEKIKEKLLELGTKRVFIYNGEAGAQPMFLSPDPKQAELIIKAIKQLINEIYHTVGMAGERTKQDNAAGIDNSSGVAKAYDFDRVNALLTSKAKSLEHTEHEIAVLVALWHGEEIDRDKLEATVKYPETFDLRALADEFDIASRLSLIDAPETVRQEQMNHLIEKLFPSIAEKLKEAMRKEVRDTWLEQNEDEATGDSSGASSASESSDAE